MSFDAEYKQNESATHWKGKGKGKSKSKDKRQEQKSKTKPKTKKLLYNDWVTKKNVEEFFK